MAKQDAGNATIGWDTPTTDRQWTAIKDVAGPVDEWAGAQAGAITDVAGSPIAREVLHACRVDFERQRGRILRALMEADYPMEWSQSGEAIDPEVVGAALASLAAAARAVAIELGWTPRREAVASRTRTVVYRRDGYACVECGDDDVSRLSLDHRVAVDLGGSNSPDNLRTLCRRCNSIKGPRL